MTCPSLFLQEQVSYLDNMGLVCCVLVNVVTCSAISFVDYKIGDNVHCTYSISILFIRQSYRIAGNIGRELSLAN